MQSNNKPTVTIIKHANELPPNPQGHKLAFRQGVKNADSARSVCQQVKASQAWLLARNERLYWFEKFERV